MELTPQQINETLKGTKYEGHLTGVSLESVDISPSNDAAIHLHNDAQKNAARAILLQRDLDTANKKLQMVQSINQSYVDELSKNETLTVFG